MMFLEMGLVSAAIGFVLTNAAISLVTVAFWPLVRSSSHRARSLFFMRMFPTLGAVSAVIGLVLPAFWSFEPRGTSERAGPALLVFVALTGILVAFGLRRTLSRWLETRRLERLWTAAGELRAEAGIPVRTYRVPSERPFAALVGLVRPRLFLSGGFLASLSEGERQAVLDHEKGHLRSLDNLKRVVMSLAPDWLAFFPAGTEIEKAWAAAAEDEADDEAAGGDPTRALDLAGALLKSARLPAIRCAAASNFCDHATIAHRVERLLDDANRQGERLRPSTLRWVSIAVVVAAAALFCGPAARIVYATTEAAIRLLQ